MAVNELQNCVYADKSQIVIEKCEADGRGSDQLQQLRFLSSQLTNSIAPAVHCSFVAGIHKHTPSVVAYHRTRCRELGAAYLNKPVNQPDLTAPLSSKITSSWIISSQLAPTGRMIVSRDGAASAAASITVQPTERPNLRLSHSVEELQLGLVYRTAPAEACRRFYTVDSHERKRLVPWDIRRSGANSRPAYVLLQE
jgi:hypothetical protein